MFLQISNLLLAQKLGEIPYETFSQVFSNNLLLVVPLDEVVILVVLVNIFALFRKPRLILAVSYIFCLKWVFWLNYTELLKQSNAVAKASSYVLIFCGILTLIFFCMDRFQEKG